MITDGKKRPRWLTDIEVIAVLLLQCLGSFGSMRMIESFSRFLDSINASLPVVMEFMFSLYYACPVVYVIPPAITAVLAAYYFWKRRRPDYDPSRILFFIGLCAFLHVVLVFLMFLYVPPLVFLAP